MRRNLGTEQQESASVIKQIVTCWKLYVISNPSCVIRHYTCGKLDVISNPLYVIRHFIWLPISKEGPRLCKPFFFFF